MKQLSLGDSGFERQTKRTRKSEFLDETNLSLLKRATRYCLNALRV